MEQKKMLSERDWPDEFFSNQSAIVLPVLEREDFVLKQSMIDPFRQKQFLGRPEENPIEHIVVFEDLCSNIIAKGVSSEWLCCKLFPYSLAEGGTRWLKRLEPRSLTTWREARSTFLNHFFPEAKVDKLRKKISTFQQEDVESFREAWERFNDYLRECPFHGFNDSAVLKIFHKGIEWNYAAALDSINGGNFLDQYPEDAYKMIKKFARSSSADCKDSERSTSSSIEETQSFAEIKDMAIELQKKRKRSMVCVDEADQGDVTYLEDQRYQRRPSSFSQVQEAPQIQQEQVNAVHLRHEEDLEQVRKSVGEIKRPVYDEEFSSETRVGRHVEGVDRLSLPEDEKIKNSTTLEHVHSPLLHPPLAHPGYLQRYNDLVEKKSQQTQEASPFQWNNNIESLLRALLDGQQRAENEVNSMYNDLNTKMDATKTLMKELDHKMAQNAELIRRQDGFLPGKTETNPRAFVNAINTEVNPVIRSDRGAKDAIEHVDESEKEQQSTDCQKKSTDSERIHQLEKSSRQGVDRQLPGVDRLLAPAFKNLENSSTPERVYTPHLEPLFAHPEVVERMPEKLDDQGSLVLNCNIGERAFEHSLCDSGSSVNVVPLSVAKSWGKLKPANMTLTLADRSVRRAKGILEDVPVKVGDCLIPTDFVVLEYDKEPMDPIILGRPFLATAGAVIDFKHRKIDLHLGDKIMRFKMNRKVKATIDGHAYQVDTKALVGDKEVFDTKEEKQKLVVHHELTKTSAEPATALKQKAPNITLPTPPLKQGYALPKPKSNSCDFINADLNGAESVSHLRKPRDSRRKLGFSIDDIAGNRSIPPKHKSQPCAIPGFLGRPHKHNAYTPPWMRRISERHRLPLSDPPDI